MLINKLFITCHPLLYICCFCCCFSRTGDSWRVFNFVWKLIEFTSKVCHHSANYSIRYKQLLQEHVQNVKSLALMKVKIEKFEVSHSPILTSLI